MMQLDCNEPAKLVLAMQSTFLRCLGHKILLRAAITFHTKLVYTNPQQDQCHDALNRTETLLCIRCSTDSFSTAKSESISICKHRSYLSIISPPQTSSIHLRQDRAWLQYL